MEKIKCYCGHTTYCDCGPEEPKQETLTYSDALKKEERIFNSTIMFKQSTLEEAFEKWADQQFEKGIGYDKFDVLRFGAKWQQERRYSEEEALNLLTHFAVEIQRQNKKGQYPIEIKGWFERNKDKFKNK